ncbi:hypothetical protein O6H91_15G010900 [Diphasiastrum complanatum]|uniref:Uncharacterized protein n=1 Tax=Diphasiastrum complanatum TaxID=34168 RepID=A0ACC2BG10_DIPCM|nr:hypothetical protein O6H91_15G010900 [Diphasiastrum complanatum]
MANIVNGFSFSGRTILLLEKGYKVVIIDNLSNAVEEAVKRVVHLAGKNGSNLSFYQYQGDSHIWHHIKFNAVIHFAGFKAVGESVKKPLEYYYNNLVGTLNLLSVMVKHLCKKLVFSSSATVYGQSKIVPCREDLPMEALNPYGQSKIFIEQMCCDICTADPEWRIMLLRYFNPVGAYPSGLIGEDPCGIPNNLMPILQQVAPTRDGTGIRDYIHIMDLAEGHAVALHKLFSDGDAGCAVYNLGTGKGVSVLEMIAAFENASGKKIPYKFVARRPGDCSEIYASTKKAEQELGWKSKYGLEEMCRDQWTWIMKNPWGYTLPSTANPSQE